MSRLPSLALQAHMRAAAFLREHIGEPTIDNARAYEALTDMIRAAQELEDEAERLADMLAEDRA